MTPDDYIPLCEKLGWPEWVDGDRERLFHSKAWRIEWQPGEACGPKTDDWRWRYYDWVAAHVALCILEKWARETLEERGMTRTLHYVDGRTRDVMWKDSQIVAVGDTEAEAQIAALKTLCKGMEAKGD